MPISLEEENQVELEISQIPQPVYQFLIARERPSQDSSSAPGLITLPTTTLKSMIEACTGADFKLIIENAMHQVLACLISNHPGYISTVFTKNSSLFRLAVSLGDITTVLRFAELLEPVQINRFILSLNWLVVRQAIDGGHLPIVDFFLQRPPEVVAALISADNYKPFHLAASKGHIAILERLVAVAPEHIQAMIAAENYAAYDLAKRQAHIQVMDYIMSLIDPDRVPEMLSLCWKSDAELLSIIDTAENKYAMIEHIVQDKSLLWIAQKKGHAPIYLLGTIHLSSFDVEDRFLDLINNLLDKVETCCLEQCWPSSSVSLLKKPSGHQDGVDQLVFLRATDMNKKIIPLENERILSLIIDPDLVPKIDLSILELRWDSEELIRESQNYLTNMSRPYSPENEKFRSNLRNKLWMPAILQESLDQKPCLVAVGAAHNQGVFGLPNLLTSEGYHLTPLIKTAPTPKSVLLYDMLTGHKPGFFSGKSRTDHEYPRLAVRSLSESQSSNYSSTHPAHPH